jgi:hypothetical protein
LLGQFTNKAVRKLAQQGAFFRQQEYNNMFGSLEEYKGSGCYMSHRIEKQKVLVIYLGDVHWPRRLQWGENSIWERMTLRKTLYLWFYVTTLVNIDTREKFGQKSRYL